jgi:hypothetical protein
MDTLDTYDALVEAIDVLHAQAAETDTASPEGSVIRAAIKTPCARHNGRTSRTRIDKPAESKTRHTILRGGVKTRNSSYRQARSWLL